MAAHLGEAARDGRSLAADAVGDAVGQRDLIGAVLSPKDEGDHAGAHVRADGGAHRAAQDGEVLVNGTTAVSASGDVDWFASLALLLLMLLGGLAGYVFRHLYMKYVLK